MLSAEHLALQSRLVQQLVAVRQKEMDYMLMRYQSIGTQAALICGFSISSLTGLDLNPSSKMVSIIVAHLFYISSFICILANIHVILTTLFVCNWAPGLALRGPTGSMSRAFDSTRAERTMVNVCFCIGMLAFAIQTVLAVWILDDDPHATSHSLIATGLVIIASACSVSYLMRMHERFFGTKISKNFPMPSLPSLPLRSRRAAAATPSPATGDGSSTPPLPPAPTARQPSNSTICSARTRRSSQRTHEAHTADDHRMPLLDNPVTVIESHPDVSAERQQVSPEQYTALVSSEFEMSGYLSKLTTLAGDHAEGSSRMRRVRSLVNNAIAGEWRERYFVLRDGQLRYWKNEADYEAGKPSSEPIELSGYEVLVDMASSVWAFTLQPHNQLGGQRTWSFRAPSEQLRLEWARRLVISTIVGSGNGS
ncbi:hypothetical protein AB1Y20_012500 [Prymnesium parvum]|uniref:PH domain-containing protein n=1 Tax=Prymnesium parvum TaxID=97485 RepID=A0AB34IIP3_PRYPA